MLCEAWFTLFVLYTLLLYTWFILYILVKYLSRTWLWTWVTRRVFTSGAGAVILRAPDVILGRVPYSLDFIATFCRSLSFFFVWSLYCLGFYDLGLLITPSVSSSFSYHNCIFMNISIFRVRLDKSAWRRLFQKSVVHNKFNIYVFHDNTRITPWDYKHSGHNLSSHIKYNLIVKFFVINPVISWNAKNTLILLCLFSND
jgi:hypothetical protein